MSDRIVSWFSCGAASAVATKLAIAKFKDVEVVRCIVREEHPDNERFASDCERWFERPIINLISEKYDGSIYEVFRKQRYIAGIGGAPCTKLLKKSLREKYQRPTDTHIFGYTAEETARFDSFLDGNNVKALAPLIESGVGHSDCLAMIERAGIELPTMYKLGYKHNNCIGCVKGGAGYWNKIRIDFPDAFDHMAKLSRTIGTRLVKHNDERVFLDELPPDAGEYQKEPEIQCGIFCHLAESDIGAAA